MSPMHSQQALKSTLVRVLCGCLLVGTEPGLDRLAGAAIGVQFLASKGLWLVIKSCGEVVVAFLYKPVAHGNEGFQ